MTNLISDFVRMSKYAGMREDLVQAGGGNSSVKLDAHTMLIKASGFQMADINKEDGYATVNPAVIAEAFRTGELDVGAENLLLQSCHLRGPRPSIETFLHAITGRFTLHTHPTAVNIFTAGKDESWKTWFPDALYVGYAAPGLELAKEYFRAYKAREAEGPFPVIFLKNHGLIVSGDTVDEVIKRTESVLRTLEQALQLNMEKYRIASALFTSLERLTGQQPVVYLTENSIVKKAVKNLGAFNHAFAPDCVVFLGKRQLQLKDADFDAQIRGHMEQYGLPVVFHYGENTYIRADSVKKAKEVESVLAFSATVCLQSGQMEWLSNQEQNHLLHMDSEKYRQALK